MHNLLIILALMGVAMAPAIIAVSSTAGPANEAK